MSELDDYRSKRFAQLVGLELKANFAREQISQAEIAEALGHSKSGYSRWLNAKPSMPLETLLNTCLYIHVDPRDIIDAAYKRLLQEFDTSNNQSENTFDYTAYTEEAAKRDDYRMAAYRDPNKYIESQTPTD